MRVERCGAVNRWLWFSAGWLVWASLAAAHPISLSSTIVDIQEDCIEASIEVMLEDLVLYHGLSTGEEARYAAADLLKAANDHCQFLRRDFRFRNGRGEAIPIDVKLKDNTQIAPQGVEQTELMSRSVGYEITAKTSQPIEFLTVMQTFGGSDAILPAVMDLMLLQNGVLMERPVQITHGRPHTVRLDWTDPPSASAGGLAVLRRQKEQAFRQRLGIASYAGLYSFLYISSNELRHEILVPLLTLEKWLPIERDDPEFLEVPEQQALVDPIERFIRDAGQVEINGRPVIPQVTRIQFFGLDANDFAINATPRRLSIYQARVGIILSHRSGDGIRQIRLQWNRYNDFAPFLRTVVLAEQDAPAEHLLRPDQNELVWRRVSEPELPEIQLVRRTSAIVDPEELPDLVKRLLANVYHSFQLAEDSDIYDALAKSATDDFLPKLYLETKRAMVMAEQGSDLAKIRSLQVLSAQGEGNASAREASYRCRWRVEGVLEHWGHVHTRINEYEAVVVLRCQDGLVKLVGLQPIDVRLVRFQTRLRQSNQAE